MSSKNRVAVNYGVWLLDMITMIISFQTALHIRYGQGEWYNERMHYVVLLTLCLCATVYHFFVGNRTFLKRGYIREVVEVLQFNCCIIIAGMVIVYLAHWSIFMSRIVFAYFFLLNIGLMLVERFLAKYFFNYNQLTTLIIMQIHGSTYNREISIFNFSVVFLLNTLILYHHFRQLSIIFTKIYKSFQICQLFPSPFSLLLLHKYYKLYQYFCVLIFLKQILYQHLIQ